MLTIALCKHLEVGTLNLSAANAINSTAKLLTHIVVCSSHVIATVQFQPIVGRKSRAHGCTHAHGTSARRNGSRAVNDL